MGFFVLFFCVEFNRWQSIKAHQQELASWRESLSSHDREQLSRVKEKLQNAQVHHLIEIVDGEQTVVWRVSELARKSVVLRRCSPHFYTTMRFDELSPALSDIVGIYTPRDGPLFDQKAGVLLRQGSQDPRRGC